MEKKVMSKKVTLKNIVTLMDNAPSGGFVGITDYESENGDVSSVTGLLGCSYEDMKQKKIEGLREAVNAKDFEAMTVSGQGWASTIDGVLVFGAKSKARNLTNFCVDYTAKEVLTTATAILESWDNPAVRKSNKVQLTDKEDGLSLNTETNNFNFTLLVMQQTYKEDLSNKAKAGKEVKVKATQPESVLKKEIRERFERKLKSFTITEGKFASITIAKETFLSENVNF
jgi:hypothetical protein